MNEPSPARGPTVLVVDDHRFSREYTVAALRESAGSVKQAATAEAALQMALRHLPDLIVTDLDLSGESGLRLVRRIRRHWPTGHPRPRVVLLSAERPPEGRLRGAGIERFLVKPVEPERLRALLAPESGPAVAAEAPTDRDAVLRRLFRRELRRRLDEIDRLVAGGDVGAAGAILHQLIASSTLCGEQELGARMREMLAACRGRPRAARIARSYYAVRVSARQCLEASAPHPRARRTLTPPG